PHLFRRGSDPDPGAHRRAPLRSAPDPEPLRPARRLHRRSGGVVLTDFLGFIRVDYVQTMLNQFLASPQITTPILQVANNVTSSPPAVIGPAANQATVLYDAITNRLVLRIAAF